MPALPKIDENRFVLVGEVFNAYRISLMQNAQKAGVATLNPQMKTIIESQALALTQCYFLAAVADGHSAESTAP